jgi:hypothetical protein
LAVNEVAVGVLVEDGIAQWVHLEVSEHVFDVELGEWEDLRDLIITEMLCLEDLATVLVDDVAELVDEVASRVDSTPFVVD